MKDVVSISGEDGPTAVYIARKPRRKNGKQTYGQILISAGLLLTGICLLLKCISCLWKKH